jgi:hypothetical protein
MGLFGFGERGKPMGLQEFLQSYRFCFQYLPDRIFGNSKIFIEKYTADPENMLSGHLRAYFATRVGNRPHPQFFPSFSVHKVVLGKSMRAIIIQYPTPPSVPVELEPNMPLPAPYFSAIVFDEHHPEQASHYVLCQNPERGTTLRSVTMDSNMNLGDGSPPVLSEFSDLLRSIFVENGNVQRSQEKENSSVPESNPRMSDNVSQVPAYEYMRSPSAWRRQAACGVCVTGNTQQVMLDSPSARVWAVSDVVSSAGELLWARYRGISVRGVLSNWGIYKSGHHFFSYFSLRGDNAQLLTEKSPFLIKSIEEGLSVDVVGTLSIHSSRGSLRLLAERIELNRTTQGAVPESHRAPVESVPEVHATEEVGGSVWTVSGILLSARKLLEERYTAIVIRGEVANWKLYGSGHGYFYLKDDSGQLATAVFSVREHVKFEVKDGLTVDVLGRLSIYAPRGQFLLVVAKMELSSSTRDRVTVSPTISGDSTPQVPSHQDMFMSELIRLVPEWQKINAEQGFLDYLTQVDNVTGKSFKDLATEAANRLSAADLAWFFSDYVKNRALGVGPFAQQDQQRINADAQFRRGIAYRDGLGVSQNHDEAARWFRMSAAQGNEDAKKMIRCLAGEEVTPMNAD